VEQAYAEIASILTSQDLAIVQERVFGSLAVRAAVLGARSRALASRRINESHTLTYVEGSPPGGIGWAGTIIHAVRRNMLDKPVEVVQFGQRATGCRWACSGIDYIVLQNLPGPEGPMACSRASREADARRAMMQAEELLRSQGLRYRDVVRTWFYLRNILEWYDEFNDVRNTLYDRFGLSQMGDCAAGLPASTGVAGCVSDESACTLDLFAAVPEFGNTVGIERLHNPRQSEATVYGSAFARAMLLRRPESCLIEVSGTAAVDESGRSLHPDNVTAQIESTLQRIASLLKPVGAGLRDISAATAFVKHAEHAAVFRGLLDKNALTSLPVVTVVADICREELLFEMDAELVLPSSRCEDNARS
jgi:enamine deaminase RidA (YjgF/YER057c/UK114 family)